MGVVGDSFFLLLYLDDRYQDTIVATFPCFCFVDIYVVMLPNIMQLMMEN